MLLYSATKTRVVLRTARERIRPEGRVETDVRILRVSSAHVSTRMLSRRTEISLLGDWLGCVAFNRPMVLGCEDFTGFAAIFNLDTGTF